MKKNKKLFLASIAAMGAVAIGTGAVSTFAWYAAASQGLAANESQTISTAKVAKLNDLEITAHYAGTGDAGAIKNVELTTNAGLTKVWNGTADVNASNQSSLVKSERIKLTFTGSSMDDYVGLTYTVKMKASGQLRIATSTKTYDGGDTPVAAHEWTTNKYVGAYSAASAYNTGTHAFTGGDEVTVGTITIATASTFTYASLLDNDNSGAVDTDGLYFYVSVTNKGANAAAESDTASDYGYIGVSSFTR